MTKYELRGGGDLFLHTGCNILVNVKGGILILFHVTDQIFPITHAPHQY